MSGQNEKSIWLRDNYYIFERYCLAMLTLLRKKPPECDEKKAAGLCRSLCKGGVLPDEKAIIAFLLENNVSTDIISELHFFISYTLLTSAARSFKSSGEVFISAVRSFNRLPDIDFGNVLFEACETEKILCRDPTGEYRGMTEETKAVYRKAVIKKAKETKRSERSVAVEALELAIAANRHIGFYLDIPSDNKKTGWFLILLEVLLPLIASVFTALYIKMWYLFPVLWLPFREILKFIPNVIFSFISKPKPILRNDFSSGIPEEHKTVIAISTLLPSAGNAEKTAERLKELCLSNCRDTSIICVLADLRAADKPHLPTDNTDIDAMKRVISELNDRYGDKFILAVRPRIFSQTENSYTGYERKRGAITALVKYISGFGDEFSHIFGNEKELRKAKYIMALDSDTEMPFGTLRRLVGTASHPLNRPVVSLKEQKVISGYGIIMPQTVTSVVSASKTGFSSVFAGSYGLPSYSGVSAEKYRDTFGKSVFSGKGLIDVKAFAALLIDRFPEQRILSHDILEGIVLRTLFAGDISLTDSFPSDEISYFKRLDRWIRGDVQNAGYIFRHKPGFDNIGKWWLADNIMRSLAPISAFLLIVLSVFTKSTASTVLTAIAFLSAMLPDIISTLATVISGGISMVSRLYFSDAAPYALTCILRALYSGILIARQAFCSFNAIVRSLFRMTVSKKHLLQWVTAADADRRSENAKYFVSALPSVIPGIVLLFFCPFAGIAFLLDLPVSLLSSHTKKDRSPKITESEKEKLRYYAAAMWRFYERYCDSRNNRLIPDNVQEQPVYRVALRTSPTNIGLMLCSFLAARDFGFTDSKGLYLRLDRSLKTVEALEKYRGNLYNWYSTTDLSVLKPAYISTVDSGNFICSLVTLKEGLKEYVAECEGLRDIIVRCEAIINGCDLSFLYDKNRKLFKIGYNVTDGEFSSSHYDLLMSEARMTSYYAVASSTVPEDHIHSLGRTLARSGRYTGAVSWTGTMFEYFMPALFLPAYRNTLSGEALRFCIHAQKKAVPSGIPYGISESGFYAFDDELNYQYKAFGADETAMKKTDKNDIVISPYSTFLTVSHDPHSAVNNLKKLEKAGLFGRYGFYEALDLNKKRTDGRRSAIVKSFMAHHIGMSFIASANAVFDDIMQKRFMRDDMMHGGESLLMEKIPSEERLVKNIRSGDMSEKQDRIPRLKETEKSVSALDPDCTVLSNNEWSVLISDSGMNISLFGNYSVFATYNYGLSEPFGIFAAFKTAENNIISFTDAPYFDGSDSFMSSTDGKTVKFRNDNATVSCIETIGVCSDMSAEILTFTVKNKTGSRRNGKLMIYAEPAITNINEKNMHPAFSDLFVTVKYIENEKIFIFTKNEKNRDRQPYFAMGLAAENEFDFSTDREYVLSRENGIKDLFKKKTENLTESADKCIAIELPVSISPRAASTHTLIVCGGITADDAVFNLKELRKSSNTHKFPPPVFMPGTLAGIYAKKLIARSYFFARMPEDIGNAISRNEKDLTALWKFGISGDHPLLTVFADKDDLSCISQFVSMQRKLRRAGIVTELAVISNEPDGYTSAVREELKKENVPISSHIVIVNASEVTYEELDMILASSAAVYPEKDEKRERRKFAFGEIKPTGPIVRGKNGFVGNGYLINKQPSLPYCHMICNKNFGTLLSSDSLGYTWAINSRENKLTPWVNDTRNALGGELLTVNINDTECDIIKGSSCFFERGSARYAAKQDDIEITTLVTVPDKNLCKNIEVAFSNTGNKEKFFTVSYCVRPVLCDSLHNAKYVKLKKTQFGVTAENPVNKPFKGCLISGADGEFSSDIGDNAFRITKEIKLPPKSDVKIKFYLAYSDSAKNAYKMANIISQPKKENKIEIITPDAALNNIFNFFLPNQIIEGRLFGRTGFYQCSGAYGFRDQLQDAMAVVLTHPELLKIQIFRCCTAQFREGDVLHWFHNLLIDGKPVMRGVRTQYSDDLLWLPLAVAEYCLKTGDLNILKAKIRFIDAPVLEPGETERFGEYTGGITEKASVYVHCLRAIKHSCSFGIHGLPLIKGGDWNDSFNEVGIKMKGESVWLAMFQVHTMKLFSNICKIAGDEKNLQYLRVLIEKITSSIENSAWENDRYLRCFYDDGSAMGSKTSKECSIDILPQAWSVIAGLPDESRKSTALKTAADLLVDKNGRFIKLFDPPFTADGKNAGYVNLYPPGIRENGGQYTHGTVWLAKAFFMMNAPETGYRLLDIIDPATKDPDVLKTEPYYLPGDVYTCGKMKGRGGWSIYSGSAGWFYRTVYEDMLGIKQIGGKIKIKPCVPQSLSGSRVKITVNNRTEEFTV